MKKARIIVLTGEGKGKSSSALGMVLRGVGHGLRVCVIQFIKDQGDTGEAKALRMLNNVEHVLCGRGFVLPHEPQHRAGHCSAAREGLALARQRLEDPSVQMVVLDEICCALSESLLSRGDVEATLAAASVDKIIILTGRNAPDWLVECADTVSHVTCIKHGYDCGIDAQPGVEL